MNLSDGTVALLIGAGFTFEELERIFARRVTPARIPRPAPKPARAPARAKVEAIPVTDRDHRDAEFRRMYAAGWRQAAIGQALGIPLGSMGWHIKRLGLPTRPRRGA